MVMHYLKKLVKEFNHNLEIYNFWSFNVQLFKFSIFPGTLGGLSLSELHDKIIH